MKIWNERKCGFRETYLHARGFSLSFTLPLMETVAKIVASGYNFTSADIAKALQLALNNEDLKEDWLTSASAKMTQQFECPKKKFSTIFLMSAT